MGVNRGAGGYAYWDAAISASPGMSMAIVRFLVGQDEERSIVRLNQKLSANMDMIPPGEKYCWNCAESERPVMAGVVGTAEPEEDRLTLTLEDAPE